MTRFLASVSILTLIYLMALASFGAWDVVLGVALASGVYVLFQSWVFPIADTRSKVSAPSLRRRVLVVPAFALAVIASITKGSIQVMLFVLKIRTIERQGIIGVPFGDRSELGVAISAFTDTLAPGSVAFDFDHEQRTMWSHVIDATEPDQFRAEMDEMYDKYQRHVLP